VAQDDNASLWFFMTSSFPETRNTLILRLRDGQDAEAWEQFVAIYEPLVYRLARSKGFQDADVRNVSQEVLLAVAKAVERWEPDPERGRFRTWLFQISRNLMVNFLTRAKHRPLGTGDSGMAELLGQQIDPASMETAEFDQEYCREVFHWAAEQVRQQVNPTTWQAFWRTSVEGRSANEAAEQLGLSVGAVHIARSRVRGRLRQCVNQFESAKTFSASRSSGGA